MSLEEATERDKALIRSSLTDLCMRLKSVSRENSLARIGSRESSVARGGRGTRESSARPDLEEVRNVIDAKIESGVYAPPPDEVPIGPPVAAPPPPVELPPERPLTQEEAKKVLHAGCERNDTVQQSMRGLTTTEVPPQRPSRVGRKLGPLAGGKQSPLQQTPTPTSIQPPNAADFEGPLCTSSPKSTSPVPQYRKQPERLQLAAPTLSEIEGNNSEEGGGELLEAVEVDNDDEAASQLAKRIEQNTKHNHIIPTTVHRSELFRPSLSPIMSSERSTTTTINQQQTEPPQNQELQPHHIAHPLRLQQQPQQQQNHPNSRPLTPNLSLTSNFSEATLVGHPSLETDCSSKTLMHHDTTLSESRTLQFESCLNDTFDNSEMSDVFESFSVD